MNKPNTYILNHVPGAFKIDDHWMHPENNKMTPAPAGKYVLKEDYARLNAEVEQARKISGEGMSVTLDLTNQLLAENARLKADVERVGAENAHLHKGIYSLSLNVAQLKDEVERLTNNCDYLDQKLDEEIDKSAMLCGQVERLTKAGDAMSDQLLCDYGDNPLTYAWNAAKEGKQP